MFCITKCIPFDTFLLLYSTPVGHNTSKNLYLPSPAAFTLVPRALFGSTWRSLGSHELCQRKTGPWKLNLETCARLARTWCCDIRSKQNGNICQKQTQHSGGTHSTHLHFETRWRRLSVDGPFYVRTTSPRLPLTPTHFPIWSRTPGCHARAVGRLVMQPYSSTC